MLSPPIINSCLIVTYVALTPTCHYCPDKLAYRKFYVEWMWLAYIYCLCTPTVEPSIPEISLFVMVLIFLGVLNKKFHGIV